MWKKRMVSLPYIFFSHVAVMVLILCLFRKLYTGHQAVMVRSSIWLFFVLLTSLIKHESCSAWKTWDNKSGPAFVIHLQSISRLHGSYDDNLDICVLKLDNANACVDTNFLLGNWISAKYIVIQCNRKINTFKPSIFLFFPKAVY